MMLKFVLAATVLSLAVHASKNGQSLSLTRQQGTLTADGSPLPLLSTTQPKTTENLEFEVTFDECVDNVDASMFSIVPRPADGGECESADTNQKWRCTFTPREGITKTTRYHIHLPAGQVANSEDSEKTNWRSHSLVIVYYPDGSLPAPELSSALAAIEDNIATVMFTYASTVDFYPDSPDLEVIDQESQDVLQIKTLTYSPREWTFTVHAENGARLWARVKDGSALNMAGQSIDPTETEYEVAFEEENADCEWGSWSFWTACTIPCVEYNSKFEPLEMGTRTRDRVVLKEATGEGECEGDEMETEDCSEICRDGTLSRPYSGEFWTPVSGGQGDCSMPVDGTCSPTVPHAEDATLSWSGCSCSQGCETEGNCCQSYFHNDCCAAGTGCTGGDNADMVFTVAGAVANSAVCDADTQCFSSEAITPQPTQESYYCFCDFQCRAEGTCCGGQASFDAQCLGI